MICKNVKRFISVLLVMSIVISCFAMTSFAADENVASIGSVYYGSVEEALENAVSGDTVIVQKNATITKNAEVKAGVTLLVPYKDGYTGYDVSSGNPDTSSLTYSTKDVLYRTLTVNQGVTLTVNGTVLVSAIVGVAVGGPPRQEVNGNYAQINLNGKMEVFNGGRVVCDGYIKGTGSIEAFTGAEIRDFLVIEHWRGGTHASYVRMKGIWVANEYDCHNIQVKIKINYGAKLTATCVMYFSDSYTFNKVCFIGSSEGIFVLKEGGYVEKTYEYRERLKGYAEVLKLYGGGYLGSISLKLYAAGIPVTINSSSFVLSLDGDFELHLYDGEYSSYYDDTAISMKFLPGCVTVIHNDATFKVDRYKKGIRNRYSQIVFYRELTDENFTTDRRYTQGRPAAKLYVENGGTLYVDGEFGGEVYLEENATVSKGENAVFTVTTKESAEIKTSKTVEYVNDAEFFVPDGYHLVGWDSNNKLCWEKHTYAYTSTVTDPTCESAGEEIHTCTYSGCGATKTVSVAAKGHSCTKTEAVKVGCKSDGRIAYWTCTECKKIFSDEACTKEIKLSDTVIPATDHAYNDVVTDPTCTEQGYTTHTCSKCGDTYVDTYVKENGHNFKTLIKSEAATCTKDGYEIYQCTACDETNEVTLEAPGHKPVKTEAVEATCENGGNVEYWTCSVCKKTFADEACTKVITSTSTTAKGHNGKKTEAKDPTCTEDGNIEYWTCERCKKIFSDEACENEIKLSDTVIPAKHSLTKTDAKNVTCTADGNIAYWTCGKCKKLFSDEAGTKEITIDDTVIKSNGHDWGEWKTTTEPTASTDGEETRTCGNCGDIETRPLSKIDLLVDRADITVDGDKIVLTSYPNANTIAIKPKTSAGDSVVINRDNTKIKTSRDGRYVLYYADWLADGEQTETTVTIGKKTYQLSFEFTTEVLAPKHVVVSKGSSVSVDNESKTIVIYAPKNAESITMRDRSDARKAYEFDFEVEDGVEYDSVSGVYTFTVEEDGIVEKNVVINFDRYCGAEYTLKIVTDDFDPTEELKLIRSTAEFDAENSTVTFEMVKRPIELENAIGVYNKTKSGYAVEITDADGITFVDRSDGAFVAYDSANNGQQTATLKITLAGGTLKEYKAIFKFTGEASEESDLISELELIRATATYDSTSGTITLNMRERENPKENAIGVYNVTKSGYAVEITNENGIAFESRSDAYVAYDLKNGSAKTETLTIKLSDGTEQKYKVVFAFTEKEEESKFDPIPELKLIRANASMQEDENGEYILIAKKAGKNAAGVYVDTNSGYTCSITSNNTVFDSSRTDAFVAYTSANESRTEETITFTFGDGTTKEYRIVFELA